MIYQVDISNNQINLISKNYFNNPFQHKSHWSHLTVFRIENDLSGVIVKDATPSSWNNRSPTKNQNGLVTAETGSEAGLISYSINGIKKSIPFYPKDCDMRPRVGDKVEQNNFIFIFPIADFFRSSLILIK